MDNKKIFQLLFSIIAPLALMACAPKLPQATLVPIPPTPAQVVPLVLPTATMDFTPEPETIPTATPDVGAIVNVESLGLLSGPGNQYTVQSFVLRGDRLNILGQTNNCTWLKVRTPAGQTGWVADTYVAYNLSCDEIAQIAEPSQASASDNSSQSESQPTQPVTDPAQSGGDQTGSGSAVCEASDTIYITNETGTGLYITLTGPATYSFLMVSGNQLSLPVCPGSYSWTASGCGGSGTGSGTVASGNALDLDCY